MRVTRLLVIGLLVASLALVGCGGSGSADSNGSTGAAQGSASGDGGDEGSSAGEVASVFDLDTAAEESIDITADGGGAAVRSGEATVAVWVPAGAADEASWKLTPLASAPEGIDGLLVPGFNVDTGGLQPKAACSIAFAVAGRLPTETTTIVRYTDDGMGYEIVPSAVIWRESDTLVTAEVEGFSSYGLAEADATDVATANENAGMVDWTIKVVGTETQTVEGWTFNYELDLFASGAGVSKGGMYHGHAALFMDGTYDGPAGIVSSFGDLNGVGRDEALEFSVVDAPLASLIDDEPIVDQAILGHGIMRLQGLGELNIYASAPNVSGQYESGKVEGGDPVPFDIEIVGEDVEVEIPNVGIFPGKILRTEVP